MTDSEEITYVGTAARFTTRGHDVSFERNETKEVDAEAAEWLVANHDFERVDDDDEADGPDTDGLDALDYGELQALAQEQDVPANQSADDLRDALADAEE